MPIQSDLKSKKKIIRKQILSLLHTQKEVERLRSSFAIQKKLFDLKEFKKAKTIMFFASFDGEVETFRMIKEAIKLGKRIVLPVVLKKQRKIIPSGLKDLKKGLNIGPYGIKQPIGGKKNLIGPGDLDLVLVPGVAFDRRGNRLGRGAGFYDKFLKSLPETIPTIGLAFKFQILKILPHKKGADIPVSRLVIA